MTKWILVCLLVLVAVGTCFGQTPAPSFYFGGLRLENLPTPTMKGMVGAAVDLGRGFLLLPQAEVGAFDSLTRVGSFTGDIAKRVYGFEYGSLYMVLGASADYVNMPENDWAAYGAAAVGGFAVVPFGKIIPDKGPILGWLHKRVSLWAGGKYKSNLREATAFPKGWVFGFGAAVARE